MKAWITIYAMVFAAGLATVLAQETKTNAPAGAATGVPANAGEVAVPSVVTTTSTPPSGIAREAKPSGAAPATQSGSAPAQPRIVTSPKNAGNAAKTAPANPPPAAASAPASTVGNEEPPTGELLTPTNAVPGETEGAASTQTSTNAVAAPAEGSGLDNKGALVIGAAILVVAGVVAAFMLRHYRVAPHGSLITSAMAVSQSEEKDDDKDDDKPVEKPEEKKPEKKFPPPMG